MGVRFRVFAATTAVLALAGCGKSESAVTGDAGGPIRHVAPVAPQGAVSVATRNTTRVGGAGPAQDAAAVARTVYPALTAATRPHVVVLVDTDDWDAALAASSLSSAPLNAPLIYSEGGELPQVSEQTLQSLAPSGSATLAGARVIRIGGAAAPGQGLRTLHVPFSQAAAGAAAVAEVLARVNGKARQVIVVNDGEPPSQLMAAAGLAAESGAPILYTGAAAVPAPTVAALRSLHHPAIYLIGSTTLAPVAIATLERYGTVKIVSPGTSGHEADSNEAIAIARYTDGAFGWGIHEPGHGLVFARSNRPLDGPAAALLSATGDYGPLLLLESADTLPAGLAAYLADIQPAYASAPEYRPVRGVYNHGWVIGDESAIASTTQAEIDTLLEISPRRAGTEELQGE